VRDIRKIYAARIVSGAVTILMLYYLAVCTGLLQPGKIIVVSANQQETLSADFARSWLRPPGDEERSELLATFIRREIAYREATRLGLGRDDADIRRRLQQKLEALAIQEANVEAPTQQELRTYLQENASRFRVDPILTFSQIYFDNTNNAIGADASARFMLGKLRSQDMPDDISDLGDSSSLPSYVEQARESEISTMFGGEFSAALSAAPTSEWLGPVSSNFGIHLIFIDEREQGRLPGLHEIEEEVRLAWVTARQKEAVETLYERLTADYEIAIE